MFWFFGRKKEIERIEKEVKDSFEKVKKDFLKVGEWISHFDESSACLRKEIEYIKDKLSEIDEEINDMKASFAFLNCAPFKQHQTSVYKQTKVVDVQTPVQTAVQTSILDKLTPSERSIVLALLYSEMKLSYDDLASMLGKEKSTIRGQINAIKQKSESLIEEITEENGKKRVFIPENVGKNLLKLIKVRVRNKKNTEEEEKRVEKEN